MPRERRAFIFVIFYYIIGTPLQWPLPELAFTKWKYSRNGQAAAGPFFKFGIILCKTSERTFYLFIFVIFCNLQLN